MWTYSPNIVKMIAKYRCPPRLVLGADRSSDPASAQMSLLRLEHLGRHRPAAARQQGAAAGRRGRGLRGRAQQLLPGHFTLHN